MLLFSRVLFNADSLNFNVETTTAFCGEENCPPIQEFFWYWLMDTGLKRIDFLVFAQYLMTCHQIGWLFFFDTQNPLILLMCSLSSELGAWLYNLCCQELVGYNFPYRCPRGNLIHLNLWPLCWNIVMLLQYLLMVNAIFILLCRWNGIKCIVANA